jgi:hypothetical protein
MGSLHPPTAPRLDLPGYSEGEGGNGVVRAWAEGLPGWFRGCFVALNGLVRCQVVLVVGWDHECVFAIDGLLLYVRGI